MGSQYRLKTTLLFLGSLAIFWIWTAWAPAQQFTPISPPQYNSSLNLPVSLGEKSPSNNGQKIGQNDKDQKTTLTRGDVERLFAELYQKQKERERKTAETKKALSQDEAEKLFQNLYEAQKEKEDKVAEKEERAKNEKKKAEQERQDAQEELATAKKLVDEHMKKLHQEAEKKHRTEIEDEQKAWITIGDDLSLRPKWKHGLDLESPSGDFHVHVRGRVNWDAGYFSHDRPELPNFVDAAGFRRARLGVQGRMYEQVYWIIEHDFADALEGEPRSTFADLFLGINKLPYLGTLKLGHYKAPITYEIADSGRFLTFLERSLPVDTLAQAPNRNLGISMVRNFGDEDRVWFSTGFFRATSDSGGFDRGDGNYNWISRLTALPFYSADGRCYVHVGGGALFRSYQGDDLNDFARFANRPSVKLGVPLLLDTGIIRESENQSLFSGEFVATFGPLSFQTEALALNLDTPAGPLNYWGTYAQVSYFLTGEHRPYKKGIAGPTRVVPHENFFYVEGPRGPISGRGAWEVAMRYAYVNLRDANLVVPTRADGSGGTGILQDFTFGVNWYLNPQTRVMFNYIRAWRDSDTLGRDGVVDIGAMRMAWNF